MGFINIALKAGVVSKKAIVKANDVKKKGIVVAKKTGVGIKEAFAAYKEGYKQQ